MAIKFKELKEAFPYLDNKAIKSILKIINKRYDSNYLDQFESNQKWIKQCFNRPNELELRLNALNELLEGFGTETIDHNEWVNKYWRYCIGVYINMGNSYSPTIIYDTRDNEFILTSWGDFVEGIEFTEE
jgi:hypothetical protein